MAALPADELQRRILAGSLYSTYATTIDRQSAHEIITARLQAAQAAVAAMQPVGVGTAPRVPGGPTPAQERAEIERRARELERIRQGAEREARAQAKEDAAQQRAAERARAADERARLQRERELSQVGTTVLRGVLGTLFGGSRRRR
jgi:hypothetical protein